MAHNIEVTIFPKPSGNVKGIIVATLDERRVGHAYLYTDKAPEVTLDKVNLRGIADPIATIREYTAVISGFADEVNRNKD
jgi:hypothetical protein